MSLLTQGAFRFSVVSLISSSFFSRASGGKEARIEMRSFGLLLVGALLVAVKVDEEAVEDSHEDEVDEEDDAVDDPDSIIPAADFASFISTALIVLPPSPLAAVVSCNDVDVVWLWLWSSTLSMISEVFFPDESESLLVFLSYIPFHGSTCFIIGVQSKDVNSFSKTVRNRCVLLAGTASFVIIIMSRDGTGL